MLKEFEILEPVEFMMPDDSKSDEAIYADASMEWLGVLAGMWDAIGKPLDERRLNKYAAELSGIPLGLLERAVSRALRNNGDYQSVPTIGAIYGALKKELGNPQDIDAAIERWKEGLWQRCLLLHGSRTNNDEVD